MENLTKELDDKGLDLQKQRAEKVESDAKAKEEDYYDGFDDSELKLIPTPNFTDCQPVGTLLPINLANETITNISRLAQQQDLVEFIQQKLQYSSRIKVCMCFASEQIDALALAIKSFEKNNAFILGDMTGIGKGRVCAGVLRYCYIQGLIPVFLTHKPYLFSDIYRDLMDIEGFGLDKNGKMVLPTPFILHKDGFVLQDGFAIHRPLKQKFINDIIKDIIEKGEKNNDFKLPKVDVKGKNFEKRPDEKFIDLADKTIQFNCVFLPYSTLSMSRTSFKENFLNLIAPKSIFVFDESHNAASAKLDSNVLKRTLPIVEKSFSVFFSSATFAKNPEVFNLYVVKTALRTAVPTLESISKALKVGGENVSEYIATGLASEGQMIRRERSFGDCKKVTDYVGKDRITNLLGETEYRDIANDQQIPIYNEAVGYFKEIRDFSRKDIYTNAVLNSIYRRCADLGRFLIDSNEYITAKRASSAERTRIQAEFISRYRDMWILTYNKESITRYKATFRENLFLALKAKFTADKIIECLTTPVDYTNNDGTQHNAPQKPVIAIKNTGEALFNELKLKEGDVLDNDFSEYLRAIYNKLFSGEFTLRKVDANIFETKKDLADRGIEPIEETYDWVVGMSDFSDEGREITRIQNLLNNYTSVLPFSVIDYLKERIDNTQRPTNIKYPSNSSNFIMAEATGRKYMLRRNDEGRYVYTKNDRIPSTTDVFKAFNNGVVDVMLINVVASTGGSAQSNPKEGVDTRPRNMFIIQFEWDINVEVQKRGRVNRTGQLNSPTYTYIISQIPVERRTYLMLRKKLRKLDANASGDQTASSKSAELTDLDGKPIEDIFNQYGLEVFKDEYITLPENQSYYEIFNNLPFFSKTTEASLDNAEKVDYGLEQLNAFVRELELYPVETVRDSNGGILIPGQIEFFDDMNEKYIARVTQLKLTNEYQLELTTKPYKAALKQQILLQLNSGKSVFSYPMFLADYYTLDDRKPYSRDKVYQKANELAAKFSVGDRILSPEEVQIEFLDDYRTQYEVFENQIIQELIETKTPQRQDFGDRMLPDGTTISAEDLYNSAVTEFNRFINLKRVTLDNRRKEMIDLIRYFKPYKPIYYRGIVGMFIGYEIKSKAQFKYTDGSVSFVFCFLNRFPILRLKKSNIKEYEELKEIMRSTNMIDAFASSGGGRAAEQIEFGYFTDYKKRVEDWRPDLDKRVIRRFLTGNILSGIVEGNKRKDKELINSWALTRFTNIDGSVQTAIELKLGREITDRFTIENQDLAIACDNEQILNFFNKLEEIGWRTMEPIIYGPNSGRLTFVWNTANDNLCIADVQDRMICVLKRRGGPIAYGDSGNYFEIQIVQPYTLKKDGSVKDVDDKSTLWNKLYNDVEFLSAYESKLISEYRETINYAIKRKSITGDDRNKLPTYNVKMKVYRYKVGDEQDESLLRQFLDELYKKYEVSFNFRTQQAEDIYNIESRPDIYDPSKKEEKTETFEEGDYQYRFIKKPFNEELVQGIPNFKERTFEGIFGGVVLSRPLSPLSLPSYDIKPFRFKSEVLIKLAISVLKDLDKAIFLKELEDRADKESNYEIGQYVSEFLSSKSVSTTYLFGDLRVPDIGQIFKDYTLQNDLLDMIIVEEEKEAVEKKNKVTFDDAERFLMILNP